MPGPVTRRAVLKGAVVLAVSLRRLRRPTPAAAEAAITVATAAPYQGWESLYRERWTWDRVVRGTHLWANCAAACSWDVFVKDGLVWREEQAAVYAPTNASLPDFNPRGCQKGGCYSDLMYSPTRLTHPLKRVGARGEGRWRRISWDAALDEVADAVIDACLEDGPASIIWDFGNIDFGPTSAGQMRFFSVLGVPTLDALAGTGDLPLGASQTWGLVNVDGTADDWCESDFIVIWSMNPSYTRIPEAHFLSEARYRGTTVVSIAPDLNASAIHTDLWINPRVGTDAALALAMAEVLVTEGLYDAPYVREQTDLPFLVREDTRRFLREADLVAGGKEDVFYVWDLRAARAVQAPGSAGHSVASLRLDNREPALEGRFRVTLADGRSTGVRPVFEFLRERLAHYTPEAAAATTGVAPSVTRDLARHFARAKAALILASFGSCKHYHSDLLQRGMILLLALTGNQGRRGSGLRLSALWRLGGFEWLASNHEPTFLQKLALRVYRPGVRTIEHHLRRFCREEHPFYPILLWLWFHGGLRETLEGPHPELARAVEEACDKGWMPVLPPPGQRPRILFATGANLLRRVPVPQVVERHLWPALDLVVAVDFRLSTTALKSDLILPAAGYYEKRGIKYAQSYLPYVVFGDKAVEPPGEARDEWAIYGALAHRVEARARRRGVGPFQDTVGKPRDLARVYEEWSAGGTFSRTDDTAALQYIVKHSAGVVNCTWDEGVKAGAVRIQDTGMFGPGNDICSDFTPGKTVYPSQWFVEGKQPWPTLTGRQQFYLDHPWFLDAGEELPAYSEPPAAGGHHPLRLTGGHTRWSIHAIWRDQRLMLRLQRGEPVAYMNDRDAEDRGITDHDLVTVGNDAGAFQLRVKLSPAVQPGQVIVYHAWEPYQFAGWHGAQEVIPSPFKRTHLVGDYGHVSYRMYYLSPGFSGRGTRVEVARAT